MPTPSEAPNGERVETRREGRKARQSPDHEPETGGESRSGTHNPLVAGSSPARPTTHLAGPPRNYLGRRRAPREHPQLAACGSIDSAMPSGKRPPFIASARRSTSTEGASPSDAHTRMEAQRVVRRCEGNHHLDVAVELQAALIVRIEFERHADRRQPRRQARRDPLDEGSKRVRHRSDPIEASYETSSMATSTRASRMSGCSNCICFSTMRNSCVCSSKQSGSPWSMAMSSSALLLTLSES